jgi:hypothetical protein
VSVLSRCSEMVVAQSLSPLLLLLEVSLYLY